MSEEQVNAFLAKFDAADLKKKGVLDFSGFKGLFAEVLNNQDEATAQLYFNGIDIDGSKQVSRDEFKDFVVAALKGDKVYTLKLIFRAFDKDRSRALDASEVKAVGKYVGAELTDDEIEAGMVRLTGEKKGALNYAQIVKLLTNQDIDAATDPYDGKLKKSGCCLLL
jgi:Ca2+-binding EF-hand superfamily protein